jgi:hypothetical protein
MVFVNLFIMHSCVILYFGFGNLVAKLAHYKSVETMRLEL